MSIVTQAAPAGGRSLPAKLRRWGQALSRELTTVAITMFGLLLVTFLIARVMPIDPVLAVVGDRAPPDVYEAARLDLGLDKRGLRS